VSAADRPAGQPLIAFAVDPTDEKRDALTAAGKASWILSQCVDAVNSFSSSVCFKGLLLELLTKCTIALGVGLPHDTLTADYLHATITDKLQLSITANSCVKEEHVMECVPTTGEIRVDPQVSMHTSAAFSQ
jgi:hypothetical protein